jgi:hypothetical protein
VLRAVISVAELFFCPEGGTSLAMALLALNSTRAFGFAFIFLDRSIPFNTSEIHQYAHKFSSA